MTHIITLSVETELSEANVKTALLMLMADQQPCLTTMKVQILDDHGPERRAIALENLNAVREALQIGLENTEQVLTDHDIKLGRTTRSNRLTAERLEAEVKSVQETIKLLEPCCASSLSPTLEEMAEALRKAIAWGEAASDHILYRENINWRYHDEARATLAAYSLHNASVMARPDGGPST